MTDPMVLDPMVLAAASVVIITAISTATVAIIVAVGRVKNELLAKANTQAGKTAEIHSLVNGSATAAAIKMTALEAQISTLHSELTVIQSQRVEDAKVRAAMDRTRVSD